MRKTGCPWYRRSNDSWYVWHESQQVLLAKGKNNKGAAYGRFAELLGAGTCSTPLRMLTVSELVEAYKTHIKRRIKRNTFVSYISVLKSLPIVLGEHLAVDLTASDLEDWAKAQRWNTTTRHFALTVANGIFRWAERAAVLPINPIRDLHKPPARSRGPEVIIDPDLHAKILSVVSPQFQDFLEAVYATGARPGEIARVEARYIVWDSACCVLSEHKTDATGRVRIIFLPQHVLTICRRLVEQYPTGLIFRNTLGNRWTNTGWKQAMARAQNKLRLARRPLTSGYRHTFATDALERGVPDAHVAELLGHASTSMVHRHYGHLAEKARALRASLVRVRGQQE